MTTKATERARLLKDFQQIFDVRKENNGVTSIDVEAMQKYISKGVDVDALLQFDKMEKWNALQWACDRSRVDVVTILVESGGANLDVLDIGKMTTLHISAGVGAYDVVRFLLSNGCKKHVNAKDKDYETPLHLCADYGSEKVFDLLIEHGANPFILNTQNQSPIELLIESSSTTMQRKARRKKYKKILKSAKNVPLESTKVK
tara:strand:+ start:57 stop:662 length:606 start_codon:yes stop_codon:yes gene_type:complete